MTPNPRTPESILIVRMSAFGDIVCALPTLRALRASFPKARLGWVVDERFQELVAHDPQIDQVFVAPLARWGKMVKKARNLPAVRGEYARLGQELREAGYEVCLDLQGIVKSGLITRMARCGRTLQMAGDHLRKLQWMFPGERVKEYGLHAVDRMLPLAAELGADTSNPRFDFYLPEEARRTAEELFAAHSFTTHGPIVALNPGAFAVHRMWPAERFAEAARKLTEEHGARVVVLGGPKEVELAEEICERSGVSPLCTAGKTSYLQLAAVIARCDVAVSGDTGPMHLAAAVGKPVVALFGPANPERTGPYGPQHVVLQKPFPCQPCYAHPTCTDYACMKALEVEEVVAAVLKALSPAGDSPSQS